MAYEGYDTTIDTEFLQLKVRKFGKLKNSQSDISDTIVSPSKNGTLQTQLEYTFPLASVIQPTQR